jgi:hypothetical protein
MPLKASHPGVRHPQPSTAYPTGVRGTEKCPRKPSDAGDRGHSKPVYLLPSSVQKRGPGTYYGATSQMLGAIVVADHRSLASGAVGYASSSDVDSSRFVERVVGFVALTSQYHRGTHVGSKQRKRLPFVDVVTSPKLLQSEDVATCALITMPRLSFPTFG